MMAPRLAHALRVGARAALVTVVLQSAVAVALAVALPEVGHRHAPGTPGHPHALVEVGGLGSAAAIAVLPMRPVDEVHAPPPTRPASPPRPRAARTRLGRDPPRPSGSSLHP